MSDYLPNEVQNEIFKRVPIKSLLRCTAVCKSWYSLITNPNFISSHFNHNLLLNQNDAQTLVLRPHDSENMDNPFVQEDGTSLYKFSHLKFPFKTPFGTDFKVVGNCMGLVCLTYGDLNIILWNPSIRKFVEIGLTYKPKSFHRVVLGFGFCQTTFDHKIVKIEYGGDEDTDEVGVPLPPQVEIYSLSSRTWKSVPCDLPPCSMIAILWSQAFLNGAIHWLASDKRVPGNNHTIVMSFDLVNEAFHEIKLPKLYRRGRSTDLFLAIYKDNLCVFEYLKTLRRCRILVMTKYGISDSWTGYVFNLSKMKICGIGKNGDILLKIRDNNKFVLHNPCGEAPPLKRFRCLAVKRKCYIYADTFMENLLLLNGQSRFVDERNEFDICLEAMMQDLRLNEFDIGIEAMAQDLRLWN